MSADAPNVDTATVAALAGLFGAGRNTVWAPAIPHTEIGSFKLVHVPAKGTAVFSLALAAARPTLPLLALTIRGRERRPSTVGTHRPVR
jgi:hypothetical protein